MAIHDLPESLFRDGFARHLAVAQASEAKLAEPFVRLVNAGHECIAGGGKILFFGNGGSAADAQHLATELAVRFVANRAPIPALALTTDTSVLTAAGNDMGFEAVFARQVEAIGRAGDLAVGFSTSGKSPNVLAGLATARKMGLATAGFGGEDGGRLGEVCDTLILVPSRETARIQELHILIGHLFCAALEVALGLVDELARQ